MRRASSRNTGSGSRRMLDRCPGASNIRTPTLAIKKCPQCGEEIEVFSNEVSVNCSRCGFTVYNDTFLRPVVHVLLPV